MFFIARRLFLPVGFFMILSGCVGTANYYHLTSNEAWDQYGAGCAGPGSHYERMLGDGVRLQLILNKMESGTDLSMEFLIAKGKSVKLSDNIIMIQSPQLQGTQSIPIKEFVSERDVSGYGDYAYRLLKEYQVDRLIFGPLDVLSGLGRFLHHERGGNSDDLYDTSLHLADKALDTLAIQLPRMMVNGRYADIGVLKFDYKASKYFRACFQ